MILHEASLFLFQSVAVNTEIPLWGVLTVVGGAIGAAIASFYALKARMTAHEESDGLRFAAVNDSLEKTHTAITIIQEDVKELLKR